MDLLFVELLGYILFIFAGLMFGLFGSGGSIIMLPILIYLFKLPFEHAKIYSLFLIFLISCFGVLKHYKNNNLKISEVRFFIFPTLIFTAISSFFIFPNIPSHIQFLNIEKQSFLMIIFGVVVFLSSVSLYREKFFSPTYHSKFFLIFIGVFVGLLTGLLGIGGGFIIVPTLLIFANLDIKKAGAISLFMIMLNTLLAIILSVHVLQNFELHFFSQSFSQDWLNSNVIIQFGAGMAIPFALDFIFYLFLSGLIGIIIGIRILNQIDLSLTKKLFSITLMLLSLSIFCIELF